MKKLMFVFYVLLNCLLISAQNSYTNAMVTGMELIKNAQSKGQYLEAANHFERIARVEKEQWFPAYHAAFARAIAASNSTDPAEIDQLLDKALSNLDQAASLVVENSEIFALQGFIHMLRIAVDPMTRGQQYSGMSAAALQKALNMNENNPRASYLMAQLSYGTAQFFGSSTDEACQLNAKALSIFDSQPMPSENSTFDPSWGKRMAESFNKRCVN
jgi:tetratricopeptide (TPR) repeat protein